MDAETKYYAAQVKGGWDNIYGQGMSSAVTYCSYHDTYKFWPESSRDDLCAYMNGKLIVTFNGIMFDSKLLLGDDRLIESNGATSNGTYSWINADIYIEMWRNILDMDRSDYPAIIQKIKEQKFPKGIFNLDGITTNTLKLRKLGNGSKAPELFQQGKHLELFEYNLQDTRVTKELYLFIKRYRYLVTGSYDVVSFK
jgi:hypothetical protein